MNKWFMKSQWLQQNKVAYIELIGEFDADVVMEFNQLWVEKYLDQGIAPVYSIIDVSGLDNYVIWGDSIDRYTDLSISHPHMGMVIIVGASNNPFVQMLSSTISNVLPERFKHVTSLDDAYSILDQIDVSSSIPA